MRTLHMISRGKLYPQLSDLLNKLLCLDIGQPMNTGNTITIETLVSLDLTYYPILYPIVGIHC